MSKGWLREYVFNIDTLFYICVGIVVVYLLLTRKKRDYKFNMPWVNPEEIELDPKYILKKKKKNGPKYNKHEEECRRIFQKLFGQKFKSVRPDWLKNPATNKNLELDGYNPTIKTPLGEGLAFEYDGKQHAEYNSHFHRDGVDEFKYQVQKDIWKDKVCKDKKVILIRIPHFIAFPDLERYIKDKIAKLGINMFGSAPGSPYKEWDTHNNLNLLPRNMYE